MARPTPPDFDRKSKMVRLSVVGVSALIAVAIIGVSVGLKATEEPTSAAGTSQVDADAPLPKGVFPADHPQAFGVPYGSNTSAPVLELFEDFQCPGCGLLEATRGEQLKNAADEGKFLLVYRPTTFLDANLRNDSSTRAVNAWGCAIDEGKGVEFHDIVYANQPETEGTGWTDEQILDFGKQIGVGDSFATCVTEKKYFGWAANATAKFGELGVQGTPTLRANGVDLPRTAYGDIDKIITFATNLGALSPEEQPSPPPPPPAVP